MASTSTKRKKTKVAPEVSEPLLVGARPNEGHGRKLTAAFEALELVPALAESRKRVLRLVTEKPINSGEIVSTIECDVALMIAVLRMANQRESGGTGTVVKAIDKLTPAGVEAAANSISIYDFFDNRSNWNSRPELFRLHAVATQRAADRIAREIGFRERDELLVSALLHDIGKIFLKFAYPAYPVEILAGARTPEERLHAERRELGINHALVGGVLARRWGFPDRLASTIQRHHTDDGDDEASIVRLADMLAHYKHEQPVMPEALLRMAKRVGLKDESLRSILYETSLSGPNRDRQVETCPLSSREFDVLRLLAKGNVYKQIARDLDLSTSTIRTHLHNIYGKLCVIDRAQAVLIARKQGWI